jgi:hypothetical protein
MSFRRAAALGLALLAPAGSASAATFFGPTPYTSVADVPAGFYASGAPDVLENFDEFVLVNGIFAPDLPAGVVIDGIGNLGIQVALPLGEGVPQFGNPTVDSVGTGGGFGGGSLGVQPVPNRSITRAGFRFVAATVADLPTAVGIVWTDGPPPPPGGPAPTYTFEFAGVDEFFNFVSLGTLTLTLGDDTFFGTNPDGSRNTGEDRFVGFTNPGGITGFSVTSGNTAVWELDDLQWGRMATPPSVVPLPASALLLIGGLARLGLLRRRA